MTDIINYKSKKANKVKDSLDTVEEQALHMRKRSRPKVYTAAAWA